ncbi:Uncharacterised protein [Mycobacterium tuberculosis]|nr:Uncharacterised protein [Mycobacterium tuberculosis]CKT63810.1 Uncharacterised protein [Mycobacterium tuberculosis]
MADQAHFLGLGGGNVPSGQQQVAGQSVGDLPDQPHGRAAHRVQAPLGLGDAELRTFTGDPDVGALQDLGAAGDRGPLDGGDQRFGQAAPFEQGIDARRVVAAVLERVARRFLGCRLEVHAGAKVATGSGEDAATDVGIVVDAIPGLHHDSHHFGAQRVAGGRPVHGHDQGVAAPLHQRVGSGFHGCHGRHLFLPVGCELVKKCNTF